MKHSQFHTEPYELLENLKWCFSISSVLQGNQQEVTTLKDCDLI